MIEKIALNKASHVALKFPLEFWVVTGWYQRPPVLRQLAEILWRLKQWLVSAQMTVLMSFSQSSLQACVLRSLVLLHIPAER